MGGQALALFAFGGGVVVPFRCAAAEASEQEGNCPAQVGVGWKVFGAEEGHKYVNGVLNGLAPKLRAAEVQHRIDIHDQIESIDNYDEVWRKAKQAGRS